MLKQRSVQPNKAQRRARCARRAEGGFLGSCIYVAGVLIVFLLCSLGTDISHLVAVRAQMRNAADAAALAGAADLFKNHNDCHRHALAVAEINVADGYPVSNKSESVTVTTAVVPPVGNDLGTVTVNVKMILNNLVTPVFGRMLDTLDVTAVAGGAGKLVEVPENILFPFAPSIDTLPSPDKGADPTPLMNRKVGDIHQFYINSQQVKNGGFTSFTEKNTNAQWVREAISQSLGITPSQPGFIPPVKVGDDIYMSNGVLGEKTLADDPYLSKLCEPDRTIWLPIIKGDPPYNQTRKCIGFMAVKVLNVTTNQPGIVETLTVRIQSSLVDGTGGKIPSTGNGQIDTALNNFAPGVVKLLR